MPQQPRWLTHSILLSLLISTAILAIIHTKAFSDPQPSWLFRRTAIGSVRQPSRLLFTPKLSATHSHHGFFATQLSAQRIAAITANLFLYSF